MKTLSRIVLAIVAVVALVAGITFVKQYQVGPSEEPVRSTSPEGGAKSAEVRLNFKTTTWEWEPPEDGQFEQHSKGSKDFWFQNDNSMPIELGLKSKSCKCSDVSVCVLSPEEAKRYRGEASGKDSPDTAKLTAQPLIIDDLKGVSVPPGAGGVVRLAWEDKKEKELTERSERLVVEVWTQAQGGGPRNTVRLELPVTFVPALRLTEFVMKVPDLTVNGKETKEFKCWSSTKQNLRLTAKERTGDPCFSCTCIELSESARKELAAATKSHVRCGYLVQVTVRERLKDDVQMELGPFARRIDLTSEPDIAPTNVLLAGVVRGEVTIESEDERGGIPLGAFPAKNGTIKMVKITGHRSSLDLKVAKVEPEGSTPLKVKSLKKADAPVAGGRTKWELTVEVPPGNPSGRLPEHSAVLLTIAGTPPRHVRIPVTGFATQ